MKSNNSAKEQILFNIFWSLITFGLSYGINFFITPYISNTLGIEAYGFISLANTLVTYIDIVAVAINAFAARYIGIAYHKEDYKSAEEYYSSVLVANVIFIGITGIISAVFVFNVNTVLVIPIDLIFDVKVLFSLVFINYALKLLANVFALTTFIKNNAGYTSRYSGIGKIIYATILIFLIVFNSVKVYSIISATIVSTIFLLLANIYRAKKFNPEVRIKLSSFSLNKVKNLLLSGVWNSINNIGNMLNSGLDLLIANQLLTSVIMGQISVSKQLANIITSLSFLIVKAFHPKQLEAYSKGNKEELIRYLNISMKIMGVLSGVIVAGFIALGKQFFATWMPSQNVEFLYRITVIVLLGDVLVVVVRPLYYINTLTNKLKTVCWITIACGALNVIGMFALIKYFNMGAYAVVGTTLVLNIISALIIFPALESKFIHVKFITFYKVVIRHLVVTAICVAILYLLSRLLNLEAGWGRFIINMMILGSIGIVIMVLGELSREEISYITDMLKRRLLHHG